MITVTQGASEQIKSVQAGADANFDAAVHFRGHDLNTRFALGGWLYFFSSEALTAGEMAERNLSQSLSSCISLDS